MAYQTKRYNGTSWVPAVKRYWDGSKWVGVDGASDWLGAYVEAVLADNPVAYWRLEETSGTTASDESGNGNDGTYGGSYTLGQTGQVDNAVDFDPSSKGHVDVGNPAQLQLTAMTIETWVYLRDSGSGIITKGQTRTSADLRNWDLFLDGTDLRFVVSNGSSFIINFNEGVAAPSLNVWHHLVATWDGTTDTDGCKVYVDGTLVGSTTASATNNANDLDILLASHRNDDDVGVFDGLLDEAALYDYALSASRIQAHYDAGTA